jgi:hypothetical protein
MLQMPSGREMNPKDNQTLSFKIDNVFSRLKNAYQTEKVISINTTYKPERAFFISDCAVFSTLNE